jgi:hypothetical protein
MHDSLFQARTQVIASGRYLLFHDGRECGEERWEIVRTPEGYAITGEQHADPPHPLPGLQQYRATLSGEWRATGLDVIWTVGGQRLVAMHRAGDRMWRVRIDHGGRIREQEGDFPDGCEVEFMSHLANLVILARRDFQVGGEHDFPVLRIGPPLMAVTPERMIYRCVGRGAVVTAFGDRDGKRYVAYLPSEGEERGYTFWADDDGFVLESYEGHDPSRPWMRLVELHKA